ncbi:MAG TPA: MarR family transcriptional regulator [Actinomycetes bacterium]|nr:MarR family transcriptional regulator [Actinomycetes bacterium]
MATDEDLRAALAGAPLLRLLALADHVTEQRWSRIMEKQHGLTSAGASVLMTLAWGFGKTLEEGVPGRATHADMAKRCWVKPATLTGIVDTLERAGYVSRVRDESDRRVVWLQVTDEGRTRAMEIAGQLRSAFQPTAVERDPAKAAIVREYLMELITTYQDPADREPANREPANREPAGRAGTSREPADQGQGVRT